MIIISMFLGGFIVGCGVFMLFLAFAEGEPVSFFLGICFFLMAGLIFWEAFDMAEDRNQVSEWETTYNISSVEFMTEDMVSYYRGTAECYADILEDKLVNEECQSELSKEIPKN
jgi:hypothetical protein